MDLENVDRDFLDQLSHKEKQVLRAVVKKVHMQYHPEHLFTDTMADMLICKFGREYSEKMLKKAVDAGILS